jgi:hypothetical protein
LRYDLLISVALFLTFIFPQLYPALVARINQKRTRQVPRLLSVLELEVNLAYYLRQELGHL